MSSYRLDLVFESEEARNTFLRKLSAKEVLKMSADGTFVCPTCKKSAIEYWHNYCPECGQMLEGYTQIKARKD